MNLESEPRSVKLNAIQAVPVKPTSYDPPTTSARKNLRLFVLSGLFGIGASVVMPVLPVRAADPYDQSLESRVEALERELNIMENDSKGKNVAADDGQVPTFLRAAGTGVQQLTISGDLRFRYNYQNEDFQYPSAGNQQQTSRYLFRLRLNLNYTLSDNFFAGVGVTTNGAADSGNTTVDGGLRRLRHLFAPVHARMEAG